jgi:rubredoxin
VIKKHSLFPNQPGKTFESYQDDSFIPEEGDPPLPPGVKFEDIKALCQNNTPCIYDYKITGSSEVAANTKQASDWFITLREFTKKSK